MATTATPLSRIIPIGDLEWQEGKFGIRMKRLWEDPETKRWAVLSRVEPGTGLPRHRHERDRKSVV